MPSRIVWAIDCTEREVGLALLFTRLTAQPRIDRTMRTLHSFKPLTTLAALSLGVAAFAQIAPVPSETPSNGETVKLEAFTVTGSNIKRMDVENVLPVTTFDLEQINIRNATQPSDLLTALPMVTGLPGNETANATQNARGDNASVSFRGLASGNTLLLLNGRRVAPHPIGQSENSVPALSVNVNTLPNRGLERIEILRDGASSIYGSDAVAGVVNYQMSTRFRGTELELQFGETSYRDGQEIRATVTHGLGFAQGKGRMIMTADFYNRKAMFQSSRAFSASGDHVGLAPAPWNVYTNTTFNGLTATSQYGQFALGTVTGTTAYGRPIFTAARPASIPATYAAANGNFFLVPTTNGGATIGTAAPARSATGPGHDYYWNLGDSRLIQPQSTRGSVFLSGEYDLKPQITFFSDLSVYQSRSISYRDPDVYTQSSDSDLVVPVTNPYNPFGNRFWSPTGAPNADGTPRLTGTPTAVNIISHRFADFGLRQDVVTNAVYRGVAGLRGKIFDSWTWESALLYSRTRGIEYEPAARISLLQNSVNLSDPATAMNPFERTYAVQGGALVDTGKFVNPASVKAAIYGPYVRNGITKLASGDFRASGDLLSLWGGNKIGGAIGGELRYEAYDDFRPPFVGLNPPGSGFDPIRTDFVSASSQPDTHGNRHVASAYAETIVPLVGHDFKLPLVSSLELSASARYESYSRFGGSTKPKYGVNWKPVSWIMVRGSYNRGFRAPSLVSMFKGSFTGVTLSSTDSYRSIVTQLLTDGPSNRTNLTTGNHDLRPETSEGKSGGIVIDVPHVKGLSVSLDYWEIRQKNVIAASGTITDDTAALLAATQAALAAGQNINSIDLGSGTANYKGDPSAVVRRTVTQEDKDFFAAYNAKQAPSNQRAVVGAIDHYLTSYINKSQQFVNGFDFDVNYRFPKMVLGNFTLNSNWTKLVAFYTNTTASVPRTELLESNAAAAGGASPKWRGTTTLSWRRNQWGAGLGFYYIARYTDSGATTTQGVYDTLGNPSYIQPYFTNGSTSYRMVVHDSKAYNANLSYRFGADHRWLKETTLRLSVNNVLNAVPPLSSVTNGYDAAVYNTMARGRTYLLSLTKKL